MDTAKLSIAYVGNFHAAWNTESHVARGFESLGHSVTRLGVVDNDHDSILAAAKELRPDILLGAKWGFKGADGSWPGAAHQVVKLVEACRPHVGSVVCQLWDLMCEEFSPARWQWAQIIAEAVDLFALTDGLSASRLGPVACIVRDGCPDDVDLDFTPDQQIDACLFVGSLYGQRGEWSRAMMRRLGPRFVHVGPGSRGYEPLDIPANAEITGAELTRVVRSFRTTCQPPWPFYANYSSDRWYVLTAHGGLLIAPITPGLDADGWRSGENFMGAPLDFDGYASKVAEILDRHDQGQLETIRRNGFEHAQRKTWDARCATLLAHLADRRLPRPIDDRA